MIKWIIDLATEEGDLVLDYHLGSGSTAATAMKMGRRFIGIEQMNYIEDLAVTRLLNVIEGDASGISKVVDWQGGGSFFYAELMEKNKGFLNEIIEAGNTQKLEIIFERMIMSPDIDFRLDLEGVKKTLWTRPLDEQKKILIQILDKNQLYFNYSEIEDFHVRELIADSDYTFNKNFYKDVNRDV